MAASHRSPVWTWPLVGLFVGCGCGWAWRLAGERNSVTLASFAEKEARASASATDAQNVPMKVFTPEQIELRLREALAADRVDDIRKWVVELAKHKGAQALRLILEWKSKHRDELLDHTLYHAALNDPECTAKLVFATEELKKQEGMVRRLFAGITRSNVEKALSMAAALPPEFRASAWAGIGREWVRMDWQSALNHGLAMQSGKDREIFLKEALGIQVKQGFGMLAQWMKTLSPHTRAMLPVDWSEVVLSTPQDFELLTELWPEVLKKDRPRNVLDQLLKVVDSTHATKAWIDSLPQGETRDRAFEAYVLRTAQQQPDALPSLLEGASSGTERTRLTSTLAGLRAFESPQAALAFADSLPDPQSRAMARVTAMGVMGMSSSQQGMEMLINSESEWSLEDMRALAVIYGYTDPRAALEAGLRMKNEKNSEQWTSESFGWWLRRDVTAASAWAAKLPPGSLHDHAFSGVATQLARYAPQTAMPWALSIGDSQQRITAMESVAFYWAKQSPDAVRNWVTGSGLDEATQQRLQKQIASATTLPTSFSSENKTVIFTP